MDYFTFVVYALLLVLALLFAYLVQSGLFHKIDVGTMRYPLPSLKIAYKFSKGPYRNCGAVYGELVRLAPGRKYVGIYYDAPHTVPAEELRWVVGCILAEGREPPDPKLLRVLKERGYGVYELPKAQKSVVTKFPMTTRLSLYISIGRVWPALGKYVDKLQLDAYPWMEVSSDSVSETMYVAPLDRQEDFFVPETDIPETST